MATDALTTMYNTIRAGVVGFQRLSSNEKIACISGVASGIFGLLSFYHSPVFLLGLVGVMGVTFAISIATENETLTLVVLKISLLFLVTSSYFNVESLLYFLASFGFGVCSYSMLN